MSLNIKHKLKYISTSSASSLSDARDQLGDKYYYTCKFDDLNLDVMGVRKVYVSKENIDKTPGGIGILIRGFSLLSSQNELTDRIPLFLSGEDGVLDSNTFQLFETEDEAKKFLEKKVRRSLAMISSEMDYIPKEEILEPIELDLKTTTEIERMTVFASGFLFGNTEGGLFQEMRTFDPNISKIKVIEDKNEDKSYIPYIKKTNGRYVEIKNVPFIRFFENYYSAAIYYNTEIEKALNTLLEKIKNTGQL